ncbi:MAG: recombinase family protein [Blastocatellia bacterium]|nr:recombinase family protein [Blastocatellia bacterium]
MKVGLYARVSTIDQQSLSLQLQAMRSYVENRKWSIALEIKDVGSGANLRPQRELLLAAARRREIDVVIVWKLDRWGRSLSDLVVSLKELSELNVGFVSLTEALDFSTPIGRAMAGVLAVFAEFERDILKERVRAGITQARLEGKSHGRPKSAALKKKQVKSLFAKGLSKSEISRRLGISRASVRRLLV